MDLLYCVARGGVSCPYRGSKIAQDGSILNDVSARIQGAWIKWRSTTAVMCDRRMSDRLKSKIYRTVIRPVAMYGTECWPATEKDEVKMAVMETKMDRRSHETGPREEREHTKSFQSGADSRKATSESDDTPPRPSSRQNKMATTFQKSGPRNRAGQTVKKKKKIYSQRFF
ncbi:unnamed protein product [Caenorhabditis auriculariae]|uniref:Uncharacterized protein n=1 Tax=Caenorhabditis auriculariae TaxID=2777116 RepID=A0A8S1GSJ4_9PELO|nr:unnamed protein product [Caenorhabditis auriculariae]